MYWFVGCKSKYYVQKHSETGLNFLIVMGVIPIQQFNIYISNGFRALIESFLDSCIKYDGRVFLLLFANPFKDLMQIFNPPKSYYPVQPCALGITIEIWEIATRQLSNSQADPRLDSPGTCLPPSAYNINSFQDMDYYRKQHREARTSFAHRSIVLPGISRMPAYMYFGR